jgi:hypothetical protein
MPGNGISENENNSEGIVKIWSGLSESNRHLNLGKVPYYHYTKAAWTILFIACLPRQRQASRRGHFPDKAICAAVPTQEICVTRADLTTGERFWRSAKRSAFSLSV